MTKKAYDMETGIVTFDFENGRNYEVNVDELPDSIKRQLMLHGASQKLGDAYASAKTATEDTDESVEDYAERRVKEVHAELSDGNWGVTRGGGGAGRVTDLARALAEVLGCPIEDAVARLEDCEKDEKAGLKKHPQIAEVLARYRAERAAKKAKELEAKAASAEAPDLSAFMS